MNQDQSPTTPGETIDSRGRGSNCLRSRTKEASSSPLPLVWLRHLRSAASRGFAVGDHGVVDRVPVTVEFGDHCGDGPAAPTCSVTHLAAPGGQQGVRGRDPVVGEHPGLHGTARIGQRIRFRERQPGPLEPKVDPSLTCAFKWRRGGVGSEPTTFGYQPLLDRPDLDPITSRSQKSTLTWPYLRPHLLSWILGVTREFPQAGNSSGWPASKMLRGTASSSRGAQGNECPIQCSIDAV
jgi:hypothetical protein